MKFLVLVVCSIAAALADVSLLTDRDGYTYSKPIPSVSLSVPEPVSPPTIAPTPGPVPVPASVSQSIGQSHGPVEQSVGQSVVSLGQSFGDARSAGTSYGPVASVGQSFGQSYVSVGQSFDNTGLVGSLPTQSYIPPVVPSPKYFGVPTAEVSAPALGSMDFSAYLPPQPKYQAPAPFKSYSAPAIVSGYNAGSYNGEGSLVSLGNVSPTPLSGYQALGPQVEAHSVGALGYFGSASLSGYHAQNLANSAEFQNQVPPTQAQAPTFSAPTVAHQQEDASTSGSITPSNEYLPAGNGQLDVRSLGGSQDLISAPVPLAQYSVFRGLHSTSPSSAAGDANLSSGPLAAPQLAPSSAAGDASLSSGPLAAPQLAAPQLTAPQLIAPQLTAPQLTAPQLAAPQLAAPQLTAPQLAAPQLTDPQLAAPQLAAPQVAAPAAADQKEYSAPASKTGGYHYNAPV